jgi:O-acetyl-ADP-ribose deacetylase (regulator of RNase III)
VRLRRDAVSIEWARGDLFDADADALVNAVNTVGVMGKGLALQFKQRFSKNFKAYAAACKRGEVQLGRMFTWENDAGGRPLWIINFPTKKHWRDGSVLVDIESGLVALVAELKRVKATSVAVPALGCGLGGLAWADVRPLIERSAAAMPTVRWLVFAP